MKKVSRCCWVVQFIHRSRLICQRFRRLYATPVFTRGEGEWKKSIWRCLRCGGACPNALRIGSSSSTPPPTCHTSTLEMPASVRSFSSFPFFPASLVRATSAPGVKERDRTNRRGGPSNTAACQGGFWRVDRVIVRIITRRNRGIHYSNRLYASSFAC